MIRKIFQKIIIVFLSTTVCILFLEISLRFYNSFFEVIESSTANEISFQNFANDNNSNKAHIYDPEIGWSLKPDYNKHGIKINKDGFRSTIEESILDVKQPKILILGDSMVFGKFVKQNEIFSEKLNAKQNEIMYVNTGVIGYSTLQEYLVLKKNISVSNIKLVILFHTLANDMWTNVKPGNFNPTASLKHGQLKFSKPSNIKTIPFYKRTMLYRFADKNLLYGRDLKYLFYRFDFEINAAQSYVWKVQSKLIQKMSNLTKKSSIPFIIVDIPTRNQLNKIAKSQKRQDLMRQLCEDNNINYYSLMEFYPKNWLDLFIKKDTHWNNIGHTFIAKFIENIVLENI